MRKRAKVWMGNHSIWYWKCRMCWPDEIPVWDRSRDHTDHSGFRSNQEAACNRAMSHLLFQHDWEAKAK